MFRCSPMLKRLEKDRMVLRRMQCKFATEPVFGREFDGIHYHSKYGHDIRNWALFEPFKVSPKHAEPIDLADPELVRALAIHRLQFGQD